MRFTVRVDRKVLTGDVYFYVDIPEDARASALVDYVCGQMRERYGVPPDVKLRVADIYGKTVARKQTCRELLDECSDTVVVKEGLV